LQGDCTTSRVNARHQKRQNDSRPHLLVKKGFLRDFILQNHLIVY